ncbi:MAG: MGMT family protein [bacterium]
MTTSRPRQNGQRRVPRADATAQTAPKFARAVYTLVRRVPRGRVVTYGQVAAILGHPRAARAVGTALANLPKALLRIVPWQRVINAGGRISIRGAVHRPDLQRELLEVEGIRFRGGTVDLNQYRWAGPVRECKVVLTVEVPFEAQSPAARMQKARVKKSVR